jgi:hypothetical protein
VAWGLGIRKIIPNTCGVVGRLDGDDVDRWVEMATRRDTLSFLLFFSFVVFFSFSPFLCKCTISLSPAPRARASLSFPSLLPFSFYGLIIINGPRLGFIPCEGKERIYYYYKTWGKTRGQVEMDSIGVRDGIWTG